MADGGGERKARVAEFVNKNIPILRFKIYFILTKRLAYIQETKTKTKKKTNQCGKKVDRAPWTMDDDVIGRVDRRNQLFRYNSIASRLFEIPYSPMRFPRRPAAAGSQAPLACPSFFQIDVVGLVSEDDYVPSFHAA